MKLFNVRPTGVLHVGAHEGEEFSEYKLNGFTKTNPIIWIEAQEALVQKLKEKLDSFENKIYQAVAWDKNDEVLTFNITSKTASSSLFELGSHKKHYPDISVTQKVEVKTKRLDSVLTINDTFDFLVLDIQGAEGKAIEGMGKLINNVKWIFTEVSKKPLYQGAILIDDLDAQLKEKGFKRVFTAWDPKAGWGDALYARKSIHKTNFQQKVRITVNFIARQIRNHIPDQIFPILVRIKHYLKKK